jgi:hypothetical protein
LAGGREDESQISNLRAAGNPRGEPQSENGAFGHAYVRGKTLKFYEWLVSAAGGRTPRRSAGLHLQGLPCREPRACRKTLAESFDPSKYRDAYRERSGSSVAAKVGGRGNGFSARDASRQTRSRYYGALRKSLEAVKKPEAKADASKAHRLNGRDRGEGSRWSLFVPDLLARRLIPLKLRKSVGKIVVDPRPANY